MTAQVRAVGPESAATVLEIVRAAFSTRPALDPPADALGETEESMATALAHGGLVAAYDGAEGVDGEEAARDVGALVLDPQGRTLWLRRVGVLPEVRDHGVATTLVTAALSHAGADPQLDQVAVLAREELPATGRFWRDHGFALVGGRSPYVELRRPAPATYDAVDAEAMRALGASLAAELRPGDVVVLSGELGAGKTTFTQGLGAGLGVRGDVTSPTFVIARVHPSLTDGAPLVHVDAYRLGGVAELDDLDLDTSLEEAVTVVEWGEGIAEGLADDRLEVRIDRAVADDAGSAGQDAAVDPRLVRISPVGRRWLGVPLPALTP
jgi:tRNA threonylcarbamoyladenosine biosynthesis protein TsaE